MGQENVVNDAANILIAEDEPAQAEVLAFNLEAAGFAIRVVSDGADALIQVEEARPDLLILDWMLPEVSGIEVCRRLRGHEATRELPIIMLTARGEEDDRIRGLDAGADDYMIKPYSPGELIARISAVLRRSRPALVGEKLDYAGITLDLGARKITRDGQPVRLAPTEFRILQALMSRPGRVLSRQQIIDLAWGPNIYIEDRTVDVHIRRLRAALSATQSATQSATLPNEGQPDIIRTARGFGYSLDIDKI